MKVGVGYVQIDKGFLSTEELPEIVWISIPCTRNEFQDRTVNVNHWLLNGTLYNHNHSAVEWVFVFLLSPIFMANFFFSGHEAFSSLTFDSKSVEKREQKTQKNVQTNPSKCIYNHKRTRAVYVCIYTCYLFFQFCTLRCRNFPLVNQPNID